MVDGEQCFVLMDEWLPASRPLDAEEALAELAGRFTPEVDEAVLRLAAGLSWASVTRRRALGFRGGPQHQLVPRVVAEDGPVRRFQGERAARIGVAPT
jgi:hypothetical protein